MIDQPTAEEALNRLQPLIGEWQLEAIPPGGEPWPGEARARDRMGQVGLSRACSPTGEQNSLPTDETEL